MSGPLIITTMNNPIIEEIRAFCNLDLPEQQLKFYRQMLTDATPVQCVSITEVFTPEEIRRIKRTINPQAKQCYKNAFLLAQMFPDRCKYVEGFSWFHVLKIEHAFNRVNDKYVDITFELALKRDINTPYVSLIEDNAGNVLKDIRKHDMITGDYYKHKYVESLRK